jgi:small subunit ribosomal protein S4
VQDFLERRLQTQIFRRGAANTVKHARQMIVHGKVRFGDRKVVYPSLTVMRGEEGKISVSAGKTKVVKHAEEKAGAEGTGAITGA